MADQLLIDLTAWEYRLLYRLDDAVLTVWSERTGRAEARNGPEPDVELPKDDVQGLKAMLSRRAAIVAATQGARRR